MAMLRRRGHNCVQYTRHSDLIRAKGLVGTLQGALATPWNPWAWAEIRKSLNSIDPHVVHVHNTFPLISPAIFHAIGARSARVLSLHNYRLFCPAAIPMRAGRICTACLDGHTVFPALKHGCYRDSHLATLPLAANVALHRRLGTWTKQVDAFIVLTEFQRERMIHAGLPADRVHVKPNFYPGNPKPVSWQLRMPRVVFAGRLTAEKGISTLISAWLAWGSTAPELRIVGDGTQRCALERLAASVPEAKITFLGQISGAAAQEEIAQARLLVLPSECFEGFPMVVREAFAFGTPVAVSDIGPLPAIVKDGLSGMVFEAGNPESLLIGVRGAWNAPGLLECLGRGARAEFEEKYTEDANYRTLMEIYRAAMVVSASAGSNAAR